MARVGRLAGALLADTQGAWYLVGDLKEPCDFVRAGFESPGPIEAKVTPYRRLQPARPIDEIGLGPTWLVLDVEGEALARLLAERLLIERNASVSERLWRLLTHQHDRGGEVAGRWLGEVPSTVWEIIRGSVLKCS